MAGAEIVSHFREELQADEQVRWVGRPEIWPLFGGVDIFFVPIAVMFIGFGTQSVVDLMRGRRDFVFFDILFTLFLLVGLYLIVGRFLLKILGRRRTYYAITNKRVLILRTFPRKSVVATYVDAIATITKELYRRGQGTITLGNNPAWRTSDDMDFGIPPSGPVVPALVNLRDVEKIYTLIDSLRQSGGIMAKDRKVP